MKKNNFAFSIMEVLVVIMIVSTIALLGARNMGKSYERYRQTYERLESMVGYLMGDERTLVTGRRIDFGYFGAYGAFPTALDDMGELWIHPNPYYFGDDTWGNDYSYDGPAGTANVITITSLGADGAAGGSDLDADISMSFDVRSFTQNSMRVYVHDVNGTLLRGVDTGDATTNGFHIVDVSFTDNSGTVRTYLLGDLSYSSEGYWYFGPGLLAGECTIGITVSDAATGSSSVDWTGALGMSTVTLREVVYPANAAATYNSDNIYHVRLPGSVSGTTL